MVSIDMEIPSCCMNCRLLGREEMYCSLYPRRDLDIITVATTKPDWCPLVEIEERKVGKWKRKIVDDGFNADWICTECGYKVKDDFVYFNYCPNCGADMRGSEND